jgi:O-antigen ligase
MAAVFYVWQLARMFLIFVVANRACRDESAPFAILTGMTFGLCYEACLSVWQRFGLGILQVPGTFGDKNLLGFASEFGMFPMFALLLAKKRGWQTVAAPVAGMVIAVLTTSRAAVGLGAIGLLLVFAGSALRGWSGRKSSVLFGGIIVLVLVAPVAYYSFEKRFELAPLSEGTDERDLFNAAASLILSDHPWGIGANNYVVTANMGHYLEQAGVPWGGGQREAIVHNFYWLTAAECGYFGVAALLLMFVRVTYVPFRIMMRGKNDLRGDLLLGLSVTMLITVIHCAYEWVFGTYPLQYMFFISLGLIAGTVSQIRSSMHGGVSDLHPLVATRIKAQLHRPQDSKVKALSSTLTRPPR